MVAVKRPELRSARDAIERVDQLRTDYLRQSIHRSPTKVRRLPEILRECREVVRALYPDGRGRKQSRRH